MDWLRELALHGVEAGWLSDSFAYAFMVNAIVAALILGKCSPSPIDIKNVTLRN